MNKSTTTVSQNHVSMCKNVLADIFSTMQYVIERSQCDLCKDIIRIPYYKMNTQGVWAGQDYSARNAMVYLIAEGLRNDSDFVLTLEEYELLKTLTEVYRRCLHPEQICTEEIRELHRVLADIKAVNSSGIVIDEEGDMFLIERG